MSSGPLSKEDWAMGYNEENRPNGCSVGCLLLVMLCIGIDALAFWVLWQMAQFLMMLVTMVASF